MSSTSSSSTFLTARWRYLAMLNYEVDPAILRSRVPVGTELVRVEHPRWNVWRSSTSSLDGDVDGLYGSELGAFLKGEPSSAFVADGSAVVVRRGVAI